MPAVSDVDDIVRGVLSKNRRLAARAITLIEKGSRASEVMLSALYPHTGKTYSVGFTGPPGAGKSTLVDDVVHQTRSAGQSVGVIAVDPNSPFSGGAILGDRIRMMRHTVDPSVFIRSMGSRGHLGGLALATSGAVSVLDAFGMDYVFLETVGVGQSELEVAEMADTTIVVLMPGLGDGVQTIKAGIMEIADIYVVNKADHPALEKTIADLKDLLRLDAATRPWKPPIVKCIATREEGIGDVWEAVENHREYLTSSGELERRRERRVEKQVMEIVTGRLRSRVEEFTARGSDFRSLMDRVMRHETDPFTAADLLLAGTGTPS